MTTSSLASRPRWGPGRGALAAALAAGISALGLLLSTPAHASDDTHGLAQIVLDPGGADQADGSDGLRIVLNQDPDDLDSTSPGSDQLYYAQTSQYCCGGVGPVLNVGGVPFGESGAGDYENFASWSAVSVVSTSGAVSTGTTYGSTTGNASAHLRYTATKGGLDYVVDRTVSYTFPNNYYTDSYTFTLPAGNTDAVKFYKGGDTAPGSSDEGYGVMLTSPVRSVISLNPGSHIQVGQREVAGSKPFDGAVSEDYYAPYADVRDGNDIGFTVDTNEHDAGFMTQWNLGSTPGTQTHVQETFVNFQAASLTAAFRPATLTAGSPGLLDLNVVNTLLSAQSGLGFTFTLPAGLTIGSGAPTTACGGTLSATPGSTTITLSGASVGATANCVDSIPVVPGAAGTYAISASSVSGLAGGLTNGVNSDSLTVNAPLLPVLPTPPAPSAPGAPTSVAATVSASSVRVSWAAPATGAPATHYRVTASPGSASCQTTGLSCVLGGVSGTNYTVTVVAYTAGDVAGPGASATTTAVAAPPVPDSPPDSPFRLTTTQGAITAADPGEQVTIVGDGFLPYSTVTIIIYSTPTVLGQAVTDGTGSFSRPVTIPSTLAAGHHTLVANGVDTSGSPRALTLGVTVGAGSSAVAGPAHGVLAWTGSTVPIIPALVSATGLVAVGAALVLVSRRRRVRPVPGAAAGGDPSGGASV